MGVGNEPADLRRLPRRRGRRFVLPLRHPVNVREWVKSENSASQAKRALRCPKMLAVSRGHATYLAGYL